MKKPNPRSPSNRPWHPTPFTTDDVYALQALDKGAANEVQQKRAINFIVHRVCRTMEPDFIPDSDRETSFAAGKRYVGLEVFKLVNMPRDMVEKIRLLEAAPKEKNDG